MPHLNEDDPIAADWRALAIAWCVLILALTIGTLPFLSVLDLVVYRVVFVVACGVAGVILTFICRMPWVRTSWGRAMTVAGTASLGLGVLCAAAASVGEARYGHIPPVVFHWSEAINGATGAWFVLVAWCAALLGIRHHRAMESARRRALAAEALARDAELRALRYQINPHFLFNTLNAISSLIVEGRSAPARMMLARLGDYFRATLTGDAEPLVLLADELALTEQYLEIEKIRLGDRLIVALNISAAALPARVPHLLLQPLVENAIRHGIAPLRGGGRLAIHADRRDGHVTIAVTNDCGTEAGAGPVPTGIGLENTAARLRQQYGDNHAFAVQAAAGTFEVRIRFPFQ